MIEITSTEVRRGIFPSGKPDTQAQLSERVAILSAVVLDLMMELEALRRTQSANSVYQDAYFDVSLLTHDSTGPSSGFDKLVDLFYPSSKGPDGRVWRETHMMRRIARLSPRIASYKGKAREAELYT